MIPERLLDHVKPVLVLEWLLSEQLTMGAPIQTCLGVYSFPETVAWIAPPGESSSRNVVQLLEDPHVRIVDNSCPFDQLLQLVRL